MVASVGLKAFLGLRYQQAIRMAFGLGSYAVLLVIAFFAFWYYTYFLQFDERATQILTIFFALTLGNIHLTRKDLTFLSHHIPHYKIILFTEYALLLLPFVITSLLGPYKLYWLIPVTAAMVLPHYRPSIRQRAMKAWLGFLPLTLFEWRGGLRKIMGPAVFLYLAAWLGVKLPYLSIFLLWLLTTLCLTFYDYNESVLVLTDKGGTAKSFLHQKIKLHLKWVIVLFLPIILLHLAFNPKNVWIVMAMLAGILVLWIFAILNKYRHYVPDHNWIKQSNFTAVIALLSILPFAFVLPAGFALYNYFKAIKNLEVYFHD